MMFAFHSIDFSSFNFYANNFSTGRLDSIVLCVYPFSGGNGKDGTGNFIFFFFSINAEGKLGAEKCRKMSS